MYPISKQTTQPSSQLSYDDVKEILLLIARENQSKERYLVTVSEIQSTLKIEKEIEATDQTIRNYGITHKGYFEKAYPEACSYNYKGDTRYRGLIIEPEKFIEEVEK